MSGTGSFSTQEVRFSDKPEPQNYRVTYFPKKYVAPPRIPLGITEADIKTGANARIRAYTDNVDTQKFTAHIDTWADSTLGSAEINYLIVKPADLDFQSGEFSTEEDHPSTNPQRETSRRINFDRPFVTPPKVIAFLKGWDMGGGTSSRLRTKVLNIDAKGFTIRIETWGNTTLFSAVAGWVAYPEDKEHIYSGTVSTSDVRIWQNPQEHTNNFVVFQDTQFLSKPSIFFAINGIDIGNGENLRIRTYVDDVSTDGMRWHIDSWGDTRLWSAGISYIAFN
ncbi:hypothetical protein FRC05_001813 [Tulasnella sp. 425]|nr:hypothetical protein FRC05_001813 [Tulasnella sp. 425]